MYQKEIERMYNFLSNRKKMRPSRHLACNSISLKGWTRNYRHRYSIKLSKNKTDLKVIKSYQYSLERSHAACID